MWKYMIRRMLVLLLLLAGLAPLVVEASPRPLQDAAVTMTVTAGYDGYYKENDSWIPVEVTVANNGPALEGALQVVSGSSANTRVVYNTPISLPTQSNKRVTLYVYVQGFANRLDVLLVDDDGETVDEVESNRLEQLSADALLYGVVSDEPVELEFLENVTAGRPEAAVALLDVDTVPEVGAALSALDVLIFTHVDSGRLTPAQVEAVRGWVSTGGQLVITGGSEWQRTTAAFDALLPVTVAGSESVPDLPALAAQTAVPFRDPGPYVVATSALESGRLLLHEEELPLLARKEVGQGGVYFLALDPALAPLLDWDGNERLWREVAAGAPELPVWAHGIRNSYAAGQALSSLPGLQLPSAFWLFLFLSVYVVVVGPVNYFVLKRMQRRELAWITIPVLILFFAGLAYLTGFRLRGNDVIINQMAVAYGRSGGEEMRVDTLLGLYSPNRTTYDVILPPDLLVRPFDRNYGQMAGSGNLDAVTRSNNVLLNDVRVDVSGVEMFVAQSYQPAPAVSGQATLRLSGSGAELAVDVQNNSELTLDNAGLFFGGTFVSLGDLAPGATASEKQTLTGSQASAVAGATAGIASPYGPYGPGGPPFSTHYQEMLGSTNYQTDPEAFPRFQLLESLVYYGGPTRPTATAEGNVTLVFWSEQPQFEVSLAEREAQTRVTTLYFLELPFSEVSASGEGINVPLELLNWRVLSENGVYAPTITELYLPPGWIELEFEPWAHFQELDVTELVLVLRESSVPAPGSQRPPALRLWDWEEETWDSLPNVVWGTMSIGNFEQFIGEQNRVRLRLENNSNNGINIRAVYPSLTGDL